MNIGERYGIHLKPLHPLLDGTKHFEGGNFVTATYLKYLLPKQRNRLLNYGVGIEIEIENCNGNAARGWNTAGDGSLRNNGYEYKTNYGVRIFEAWTCLTTLETMFKAERAVNPELNQFTERCSVHVHLDCRSLTTEQLNSVSLLYLLVENPLFNFAGAHRAHNIFCVPLLQSVIGNHDMSFKSLMQNPQKYAALNFKTLQQFGTLEFRHMEGTDDAERIFSWVLLIGALRYHAETVPNAEIQKDICKLKYESHYDEFINRIFGRLSRYIKIDQGLLDNAVSDAKLCFYKGSF